MKGLQLEVFSIKLPLQKQLAVLYAKESKCNLQVSVVYEEK